MADHREHVIQALEEAIPFIESRGYGGTANIMQDALELLKNEPRFAKIRSILFRMYWCCPLCGVAITEGDRFCRMCGQAVKWDA